MCTVSWLEQAGGYQLFCNRDEKRTRGTARPPETHMRAGLRYTAPTDSDHGGAWIAVNELGFSICLLNGDHPSLGPATVTRRSRGHVVTDLATSSTPSDALQVLRRQDLRVYNPFVLLLLAPNRPAVIVRWNGVLLRLDSRPGEQNFLTSSSYDVAGVRRSRVEDFTLHRQRGMDLTQAIREFHACHGGGASAYSTCMHRSDAETVSYCEVHVSPGEVTFLYSPAAPCLHLPAQRLSLPLAAGR